MTTRPAPAPEAPPPARTYRPPTAGDRMLVVHRRGARLSDETLDALPYLMNPGDLVVVNDAATVPASLLLHTAEGCSVELRLARRLSGDRWQGVAFGEGDWRTDTDQRAAPPSLTPGDVLTGPGLSVRVTALDARSPRLIEVSLRADDGGDWLSALHRAGRPVQYAYLREALALARFQTPFATRPWSVEMPSAARALRLSLVRSLRDRGVGVATLTHGAGLSATGDPVLDATLPWPERSAIPPTTVDAIAGAKARGGRILAVGTTVVRALEGAAMAHGRLVPGERVVDLVLGPGHRPRVVDALLTNVHAPGESHHELLRAFADDETLAAAHRHAIAAGYRSHELGDATLIL